MIVKIATRFGLAAQSPIAQGVALTFMLRILGAFMALATTVIMARSLGPEGRGVFAAASALAMIGVQFASLGLPSSNTYSLAADRALLKPIIANSVLVACVLGGVTAAALWIYSVAFGTTRTVGSVAIGWALISVPISLAYTLLVNLLIPLGRLGRYNAIEMGMKIATLLLVGAVLAGGQRTPEAFLVASLASSAIAAMAAAISVGFSPEILHRASPRLLWKQVPFALKAHIASLLAFLLLRIDMLMVQAMSGNAEAGRYGIAVAMADMLYMLPAVAASLLFPKLVASKCLRDRKRQTWRMSAGVGVVMVPMALVAAFLASWAIELVFGSDFIPAAAMFHVLAAAIVLYGMNNVLSSFLAAQGFPWSAVWVWAIGITVNVTLNIQLIPAMGGVGAAWGSVAGYGVVLAIQLALVLRARG